ncbi:MAG: ATP-binding cassette domain-containing protein [Clostridiales bacterium]|jgi:ATPase subunit of ABC transporter with duplicated ATPase domains|nr:ATP-binding cassette domain-containing protein [Clostridiales bacterium]
MSILTVTNLTHTFDGNVLFENANLAVNKGEHTGIVGLNGAGKSTFMNILTGRVIQDGGEVKWLNGISRGYLDQHADIDQALTVMEYLEGSFRRLFELNEKLEETYKKMENETDGGELDRLIVRSSSMLETLTKENFFELSGGIKKVAGGLGIAAFGYDTQIGRLSGGQRAKVMLARLLLSEPDVILLDEPTNFLDTEHIKWLTDYINSYKGTVLVVSHDEDFLNDVSKNIISVEGKSIKKYSGNYRKFLTLSEISLRQHADKYERQQQEIKKLEDYIAKNKARASTAGMANSRKKQLEKIEAVSKPAAVYPSSFNFPYIDIHSKDMLTVKDLAIGYEGRRILPPINFHMDSETKLWIRGSNGVGKSTLLKTLSGRLQKIGGFFAFSPNAQVLYLEQDLEFYSKEENAAAYMNRCFPRMNVKEIRTELGKAGIRNDLALKPIGNLSGGERVKVKLCAVSRRASNFLILDEPTNHLDVKAKESLADALNKFRGAVILVTHEKSFAEDVCGDVIDLV